MSDEQQQETPVWHSIVGDGWEPVLIGERTKMHEQELFSKGWLAHHDGGFIYSGNMRPRRRRKRSYDVLAMKDGVNYCRVKAAKPGDCFMLTDKGELIPVDKPPTQSAE